VVDGEKPGVYSRDEGKHTGRNDRLFVEKMMWMGERTFVGHIWHSCLFCKRVVPKKSLAFFVRCFLKSGVRLKSIVTLALS